MEQPKNKQLKDTLPYGIVTWIQGQQYAADGTPLEGSYDMMGKPLVFVNSMPDGITGEADEAAQLVTTVRQRAFRNASGKG